MPAKRTAIITGASGGIGSGLVQGFREAGYNVVATSLNATASLISSPGLALVDGDIGKHETAARVVQAAVENFGSVDVLVNTAGILRKRAFTNYTTGDFNALASANLLGFLYVTQLAVKQMLKQGSGSVVTISASLADHPIAGINVSVSMMTKGGLNSATRNLAMEYAKEGIRFNAVAPGAVATSLQSNDPADASNRSPMGRFADVKDVVESCSLFGHGMPSHRRGPLRGRRRSRRPLVVPPGVRKSSSPRRNSSCVLTSCPEASSPTTNCPITPIRRAS